FDFLGMHFRLKRNRSNPKRLFCYRWPTTRAMQSVRRKVRDAIGYDDIYNLADNIRAVNPILRGWGQDFSVGNAQRPLKKVASHALYATAPAPYSTCGPVPYWGHGGARAESPVVHPDGSDAQ